MTDARRILVIDDSTTLRKLVEIAFRGTPAEVDFAATGTEGINRAIASPPDVVLLDFILPDMRGVDVCQRLASHGGTANIPVVVMSAKGDGLAEVFRDYPRVVDFVAKPFAIEEIRDRLGVAMRKTPAVLGRGSDIVSERPSSAQTQPIRVAPQGEDIVLAGELSLIPPLDVLRFVAHPGLSGALTLEIGARVVVFIRHGEVLMCTTTSAEMADLGELDLGAVPRTEIERARIEQTRTGKPPSVTLADSGLVRASDLPMALRGTTKRLLRMVLEARAGRFAWQSMGALPTYVEAFGRPVSVTALALDQARSARPHEPVSSAFLDSIYERTPRFSRKVSGARLSSTEQSVLALVDGETPIRTIIERAGISEERAASVFARLRAVDLVQHRERPTATDEPRGSVAVLDRDGAGFNQPLREMLRRRQPAFELIDLHEAGDIAETIARARPRLVLLAGPDAPTLGRVLPAARASAAAVVVVLDRASPDAVDAHLATGVDAVLVKPVHVNEIERLLSS